MSCKLEASSIDAIRALPLTELVAWDNPLGEAGARSIANAPFAAMLETLDLSMTTVNVAGVEALARSTPRLRHLFLSQNGLRDAGVIAIAKSMLPTTLETLRLNDNGIGEDGARALADVEWPRLQQIELYGSRPGKARKALLQRFADRLIGAR
jgi:Ran GTPase-activating protein (RanGAP) involved in mRNA processing and transport